jgi:hypothetical protein
MTIAIQVIAMRLRYPSGNILSEVLSDELAGAVKRHNVET